MHALAGLRMNWSNSVAGRTLAWFRREVNSAAQFQNVLQFAAVVVAGYSLFAYFLPEQAQKLKEQELVIVEHELKEKLKALNATADRLRVSQQALVLAERVRQDAEAKAGIAERRSVAAEQKAAAFERKAAEADRARQNAIIARDVFRADLVLARHALRSKIVGSLPAYLAAMCWSSLSTQMTGTDRLRECVVTRLSTGEFAQLLTKRERVALVSEVGPYVSAAAAAWLKEGETVERRVRELKADCLGRTGPALQQCEAMASLGGYTLDQVWGNNRQPILRAELLRWADAAVRRPDSCPSVVSNQPLPSDWPDDCN